MGAPVPDARIQARPMLVRQVDYYATAYRRTWKGSAVMSFVQPWLYVAAMGVLLGRYVDAGPAAATLGGASTYLEFVAPGLLAATAMQVATGEVTWPVLGAIKWDRTYFGMLATPLRVVDIVRGHLVFVALRVLLTSTVFVLVLSLVGLVASPTAALLAVGSAMLVALAFATPIYGYSAGAGNEQGFNLIYRLLLVPMFLFSGAFFPVENLPAALEWVARLTPLWHGVELCRASTLGVWGLDAIVHLAYLAVLAGAGAWWSVRRLTRRLVV